MEVSIKMNHVLASLNLLEKPQFQRVCITLVRVG
jgi:hypothetical protein